MKHVEITNQSPMKYRSLFGQPLITPCRQFGWLGMPQPDKTLPDIPSGFVNIAIENCHL
jgi:hypothetical protein